MLDIVWYSRYFVYLINTVEVAFISYDTYHKNIVQFSTFVNWEQDLQ